MAVLDEFAEVFTERPVLCKVGVHEIYVTPDFKPRRLKAYKVTEVLKSEVARQIQELLDLGFIEPSNSEMASTIICISEVWHSENVAPKCYVSWYLREDIRVEAYLSIIRHRVPGSYNACDKPTEM